MDRFRVWIRAAENKCRLRVDGPSNARWLLDRLGRSFVFKTADPVDEEFGTSYCTFQVAYNHLVSARGLAKLLGGIPEVRVVNESGVRPKI